MTQQDNVATGFILVTAAGLATALGAGLVYSPWFVKIANKKFLAGSLGLAAGVMMFVSFIEIFFKSNDAFVEHGFKENVAFSLATALFFAGIVFIQLLDLVVHSISDYEKDLHEVCDVVLEKGFEKNVPGNANKTTSPTRPSTAIEEIKREVKDRESQMQGSIADVAPRASTGTTFELTKRGSDVENMSTSESTLDKDPHRVRLNRMGLMTALAIGIHNFPEGLATFLGTLDDPSVGAALALAIGIHNIPEGLCVAIPIFYSTGSRHKSFLWALLSGVSEPIGAAIGYAVVVASGGEVSPLAFGILFGLVAGMMVTWV
ncbi:hypothetical protein AAMO2058_000753200 [Amorphochlora amoebiformis]